MSVMVPEQYNFASGEVSPLLHGRRDFQRVQTGVRTARGFMPLPQGPITRAPGTIFRGETKGNMPARLIPFEFAENDALTLELTAGTLRVWRYGDLVESGASAYELAIPWTTIGEIRELDTEQSADVIYVASPERPIHSLARAALDSWSVDEAVIETGPFELVNLAAANTVQCSRVSGSITITLSAADMLEAAHAGALFRVEVEDYSAIPLWSPSAAISVGVKRRYEGRIYEFRAGTDTGTVPPTHLSGIRLMDATSGAKWKYISGSFGIARLTAQLTATTWSAEVLRTIPEPCVTDPTYRWARGAWSDVNGYPRTLAIYDEHLFAAATDADPRTFWFSVLGDYTDFTEGVNADQGGGYTIPGSVSLNAVRWLYPAADGLLIGALGDVFRVFPPDSAASIGPTNIRRVMEAKVGATAAKPVFPYSFPVMIAKGGRRLLELRRGSGGQPDPALLSLPAQHIAATGMSEITWQSEPYGTAWIARAEGGLAGMTYMPEQDVLGWFTVPLAGGAVESMAVTPHPELSRDVVSLVVAREIGGLTRYFVEELADNSDVIEGAAAAHEAVHLFAASVFAADPATDSFTVAHLAGENVWAWTDLGSFGPLSVAGDGTVTLPAAVGHAVIGLFDATHELEPMPVEADAPDGSAMGRNTRLHAGGGVRLHRTAGGTVQTVERDFGRPERVGRAAELVPRAVLAADNDLFTGVRPLGQPSGFAHEVSHRFKPAGGAPLTIAGLATPVEEVGP